MDTEGDGMAEVGMGETELLLVSVLGLGFLASCAGVIEGPCPPLLPPPFVMFYLTFLLPEAGELLRRCGLEVEVRDLGLAGECAPFRLVLGRRPAG